MASSAIPASAANRQRLGLAGPVDHVTDQATGDRAVDHLEVVGGRVVDAEVGGDPVRDLGEAAGDHREPVAEALERADQGAGAGREHHLVVHLLQGTGVEPREQRDPLPQALLEVQVAAHRRLGDPRDLGLAAGVRREHLDHLALDQRRVHVERDEAAIAAEDRVVLERDVDFAGLGDRRERRSNAILVDLDRRRRRGRGELDAEALRRPIAVERRAR